MIIVLFLDDAKDFEFICSIYHEKSLLVGMKLIKKKKIHINL